MCSLKSMPTVKIPDKKLTENSKCCPRVRNWDSTTLSISSFAKFKSFVYVRAHVTVPCVCVCVCLCEYYTYVDATTFKYSDGGFRERLSSFASGPTRRVTTRVPAQSEKKAVRYVHRYRRQGRPPPPRTRPMRVNVVITFFHFLTRSTRSARRV